jgi:hypothetical protein
MDKEMFAKWTKKCSTGKYWRMIQDEFTTMKRSHLIHGKLQAGEK